ncbi:unnamed protein product [Gordionus sp. m RMFG-2023]
MKSSNLKPPPPYNPNCNEKGVLCYTIASTNECPEYNQRMIKDFVSHQSISRNTLNSLNPNSVGNEVEYLPQSDNVLLLPYASTIHQSPSIHSNNVVSITHQDSFSNPKSFCAKKDYDNQNINFQNFGYPINNYINYCQLSAKVNPTSMYETEAAIAVRAAKMVDMLARENDSLRKTLEQHEKKICQIQKLEIALENTQRGHDILIQANEKRENLEKMVRMKLETEIKKLKEQNQQLLENIHIFDSRNRLLCTAADRDKQEPNLEKKLLKDIGNDQSANVKYYKTNSLENITSELNKKDVIIGQMISQNKELIAINEKKEMEILAQKKTFVEQMSQLEVLQKALLQAQTNVLRLEEIVSSLADHFPPFIRKLLKDQLSIALTSSSHSLNEISAQKLVQDNFSHLSASDRNIPLFSSTSIASDSHPELCSLFKQSVKLIAPADHESTLKNILSHTKNIPYIKESPAALVASATRDNNELIERITNLKFNLAQKEALIMDLLDENKVNNKADCDTLKNSQSDHNMSTNKNIIVSSEVRSRQINYNENVNVIKNSDKIQNNFDANSKKNVISDSESLEKLWKI